MVVRIDITSSSLFGPLYPFLDFQPFILENSFVTEAPSAPACTSSHSYSLSQHYCQPQQSLIRLQSSQLLCCCCFLLSIFS